jgi:protocatechuate 3,4-dioxygenase alpha subunit
VSEKPLPTAGQTVGPFFGYALPYDGDCELVPPHHPRAVLLTGTVYDGAGEPVPDALLELWQPDEDGDIPSTRGSLHRDGHTFTGFGRSATNLDGVYQFWTLLPGALAGSGSAPFFSLLVLARGLTDKLHTRIYLPAHEDALVADPVLSCLPAGRRTTLVAHSQPDGSLRHDLHLQGEDETVFLDFS